MNSAIVFLDKEDENKTKINKEPIMGMDFGGLINKSIKIPVDMTLTDSVPDSGKKRGRPRKETKKLADGTEIVLAHPEEDLTMLQSNAPYEESYAETNNMLKSAILQADIMTTEIKGDLDTIRLSKTLKKKYDYIALLAGTSSTLLGTKVSAIRELNKTITDSHNLELKRFKDLKLGANEVDDDKKIMDLYNAFISTPIGNAPQGFMPSSTDITMGAVPNINRMTMGGSEAGYLNYVNNLTPEQNSMRFESDPNIQTVVVFDKGTGRRWFDVINVQTGESMPNVSKPDAMFLEDTTLDMRNNIARNTNLDTTYPLIVQGNDVAFQY